MSKLKFLLMALALCITVNADTKTQTAAKNASPSLSAGKAVEQEKCKIEVPDNKVAEMQRIMKVITQNASNSAELFKMVSGQRQYQDSERELPVQGAITEAIERKMRIICYQEGEDVIKASTDPTLIGKPLSELKTTDGKNVRDLALETFRTNNTDEVVFTYESPKSDLPLVDGKPIHDHCLVLASGRRAFAKFDEEKKKLMCLLISDING